MWRLYSTLSPPKCHVSKAPPASSRGFTASISPTCAPFAQQVIIGIITGIVVGYCVMETAEMVRSWLTLLQRWVAPMPVAHTTLATFLGYIYMAYNTPLDAQALH